MAENVLIAITVSRKNDVVKYRVDCSKEVKNEELAHYLDEIISGICSWKPEVCGETTQSFSGTISEKGKGKK
jgi:hypothetical protein